MKNSDAFTLIELVMVMILMAIVGAVVGPKIFTSGYKSQGDVLKFITDVRYIQHESMMHGGGYGLAINPSSKSYYFFYENSANKIVVPGAKSSDIYVDNKISAANSSGATVNKIYFDYLGRTDIDNNSLNNNEMDFSNDNPYRQMIIVDIDGIKVDITPYSGGVYEE